MVGRETRVDMSRVQVLADRHPGMLDRVVREQELRADRGRGGMRVRVVEQHLEPAWERNGVVVQEEEVLPACRRGTIVASRREPGGGGMPHNVDVVIELAQELAGGVRRAVIDDYHLGVFANSRVR